MCLCPYELYCFFVLEQAPRDLCRLSLHDALPMLLRGHVIRQRERVVIINDFFPCLQVGQCHEHIVGDRKSTRLNSSHANTPNTAFCLKKHADPHVTVRPYLNRPYSCASSACASSD